MLLVSTQDGCVLVSTYNWTEFFSTPFRQAALKGINAVQHLLTVTHEKPGTVVVEDTISGSERETKMLQDSSWKLSSDTLFQAIPPPRLSLEQRKCLHEKFRAFFPVVARTSYTLIQFKTIQHPQQLKDKGSSSYMILISMLFALLLFAYLTV